MSSSAAMDVSQDQVSARADGTPIGRSRSAVRPAGLLWRLPVLGALMAFAVTAAAALRYRVDVPYMCQWWFTYDLRLFEEGKLQLGHLWWQHNEHRIMFPKMILLPLAHWTRWNTVWEVGLNLACAGLTFLCMVKAAERIVPWRRRWEARWFLPVAAFGFFSLGPWEAWLWGWTLQIFLNMAAAMAGIALLSAPRLTVPRLAGAMACGIVASYSFANGLVYWFAVLPLLVLGGPPRVSVRRRRAWLARLAVWSVLGAAIIALFFYGYQMREIRPLERSVESAVKVVRYLAAFLGAPLRPRNFHQSQFFGFVGLGVLLGGSWLLLCRLGRASVRRLAPVWAVALYPLLSAAAAVPGRVQSGDGAMNISRHLYIAAPFWVAVYAILFAVLTLPLRRGQEANERIGQGQPGEETTGAARTVARPAGRRTLPLAAAGLIAILALIHVWGSWRSLPDYRRFRAEIGQSRADLLDLRDDGTLWRLHNNRQRMIDLAGWLKEQKLSIFRER